MRIRRLVAAAALLVTPLVAAPAASADIAESDLPARAPSPTTRLAGAERNATAAAVATAAYPGGASTVLLARRDSFPDALAGSYLSGQLDAPLLLTSTDNLDQVTADAIDDLGATTVIILGGPAAVGQVVEDALEADGVDVRRIQGDNRYETAAAIATAGDDVGTAPDSEDADVPTALLATGLNFPDALSAGPLAAIGAHPLLLTEPDTLPTATRDALLALGIEQVVLFGGTAVVGASVVTQIEALGIEVVRVAGADRFATAAAAADLTVDLLGLDGSEVLLATGRNFPDALSLAALADVRGATLVLAEKDRLTTPSFDHVDRLCGAVGRVTAAGGTAVLDGEVLAQAALAASCADIVVPLAGELEVGTEGDPDGFGLARVYLDADDPGTLCVQLEVDGIEQATAAHIHEGVADATGPVAGVLPTPARDGFAAGCLDDADVPDGTVADLSAAIDAVANAFYVNVHNDPFPAGVVRGNLAHTDVRFLDGAYEVDTSGDTVSGGAPEDPVGPDPDTTGARGDYEQGDVDGIGTFQYTLLSDRLCYQLDASDLESEVVAAHVHEGRVDANGPVELVLDTGLPRAALTRGGCVEATDTLLDAIADGADGFYTNVHSIDHPAGAIRGQLGSTLATVGTGYAEVADGLGFQQGDTASATLVEHFTGSDQDGTTVLCTEVVGFGDPVDDQFTAGHVHVGTAEVAGPVAVDLELGGAFHEYAVSCVDVDTAALAVVAGDADGHYVNLHTTTFPGGANRGQLDATIGTFMTGAQEVATGLADGTFDDRNGEAVLGMFAHADSMGLCWTLVVDSLSGSGEGLPTPTGLHVHEGAENANGPVVLNLLAPGAAGFGEFDPDLGIGFGCISDDGGTEVADVLADPDGFYGNLHTELFPSGAVRGQLG